MGPEAFEEAQARLVLEVPLTLRASQQGWLVRASHAGNGADTRWQRLMRKSFGGFCEPSHPRDQCLSLLDDVLLALGPGVRSAASRVPWARRDQASSGITSSSRRRATWSDSGLMPSTSPRTSSLWKKGCIPKPLFSNIHAWMSALQRRRSELTQKYGLQRGGGLLIRRP